MFICIVLLLVGLALIIFGADRLVDGASSLARKIGLSEFVIGATVVGMGTSAPEMVVSFLGAIRGNADIAVGNVIGSNIFNVLLILGITAWILPMKITKDTMKWDIPVNFVATILVLVLGMGSVFFGDGTDELNRIEGAFLLLLFIVYIALTLKHGKQSGADEAAEAEAEGVKTYSVGVSCLLVLLGLVCLVFGGRLFVDKATELAQMLHISEKFVAIFILAGGTSMPELATCIVAAAKKKGDLALGNIVGSNIFNILLILGGSAMIHPLSLASITLVDVGVLVASAIFLWTSAFVWKKGLLDRFDATIFLLTYFGYMWWLFTNM